MSSEEKRSLGQGAPASQGRVPQQPPARLMITKMELENFKSYAGEKEIGPFHKVPVVHQPANMVLTLSWQCFSSIVGPNGSGKSNVIDALLFVFGKRAKQIRLKKLSELIHKSSRFPNLQSCKVSVHFQEIIDTVANCNSILCQ